MDQDVEVLGARAMIVNRRAQTIITMHGRVRHAGDPFLLKSKHDLGVERPKRRRVSPRKLVAKADDIYVGRHNELKVGLGLDHGA